MLLRQYAPETPWWPVNKDRRETVGGEDVAARDSFGDENNIGSRNEGYKG